MPFAKEQLDALSAKLDGGHVKSRKQGGRNVSYVEGWHAIAEANRIFGFDGWDRETVDIRMVTERTRKIGQPPNEKDGWGVGYIAKVRVTVFADETEVIREGTGYGSGIDVDVGAAHESAIKEAETDAMKRALMTFGNPFGLALYDKDQENVERGNGHSNGNGGEHRTAPAGSNAAAPPKTGRNEGFFQRDSYEIDPKKIGSYSKWETGYRAAAGDCLNLDEFMKLERDNAQHLAAFCDKAATPVIDGLQKFMSDRARALAPKSQGAAPQSATAEMLNDQIPF